MKGQPVGTVSILWIDLSALLFYLKMLHTYKKYLLYAKEPCQLCIQEWKMHLSGGGEVGIEIWMTFMQPLTQPFLLILEIKWKRTNTNPSPALPILHTLTKTVAFDQASNIKRIPPQSWNPQRLGVLLGGSQHGTNEGEGEDGEFHLEVCVRENIRSSGMPMSLGSDVLHVHYLV